MAKKLPKVYVDGEELNKCPLCGVGVNISAWNKWKTCIHCHKLIETGITPDKVKRVRASELSGEALASEDAEELTLSYKKQNLYNFRTTFPPGIRIVTRDSAEAKFLQEVYHYYSHYGENIPEFNVLISGILQGKLDLYRNSKLVSEADLPYNERKGVKEIDVKLSDQINKTSRLLDDFKDRVDSQAGNILTSKFGSMLKYLHDNEQEYMGIGLCEDCGTRIIFKTNFPTFKTWLIEKMDEIKIILSRDDKIDKRTLNVVLSAINSELDDASLAKTYMVEHTRQLEASMIESIK